MKIKVQARWEDRPRTVSLDEILQPHPYDAAGELEKLQACVAANARATGKLLAWLVDHKGLSVETALAMVEQGHLEVVT